MTKIANYFFKKILVFTIHLYQLFFVSKVSVCRFRPTCSQYAKVALEKYGLVKGLTLAVRRLASCHPFSQRPYYDPV